MQERFGITYKDAAHRLFLAEVERLKLADAASNSFGAVRKRLDNIVEEEIFPPIKAIDDGEFNEYFWMNGMWCKRAEEGDS